MFKLDRLERVELREIWPNEATNFTPWLAEAENLSFPRGDPRYGS